jgi:hypothetical protein
MAYHRTPEGIQRRQVSRLPCTAQEFFGDRLIPAGWNPIIKTFLLGTRAEDNIPLTRLRSSETTLVPKIYSYLSHPYANHVRLTLPADLVGNGYDTYKMIYAQGRGGDRGFQRTLMDRNDPWGPSVAPRTGYVSFCKVNQVEFPPSNNRNVNMMPFILGNIESLPEDLKCYYPMIDACPYFREENGKV